MPDFCSLWPVQCVKWFSTGFASGPSGDWTLPNSINFLLPWVVLLMVFEAKGMPSNKYLLDNVYQDPIKSTLLPNFGFRSTSWDPLVLDEGYLRHVVLSDSLCFKMCLHLSCWNQNAIIRCCHLSITLHVRNTPLISDRCARTMSWSYKHPYCGTYHDLSPDLSDLTI